jgi:hypothetical protein
MTISRKGDNSRTHQPASQPAARKQYSTVNWFRIMHSLYETHPQKTLIEVTGDTSVPGFRTEILWYSVE